MSLIILLTGKPGVGKDTVASIMCNDVRFTRLAFADALKEEVSKDLKLPLDLFNDRHTKDMPISKDFNQTPRDLLITHATELRRKDIEVYSRRIVDKIRQNPNRKYVISDWRFLSEEAHLKREFPQARIVRIRVERPWLLQDPRIPETEVETATFTVRIVNEGTIEELKAEVYSAMHTVIGVIGPLPPVSSPVSDSS